MHPAFIQAFAVERERCLRDSAERGIRRETTGTARRSSTHRRLLGLGHLRVSFDEAALWLSHPAHGRKS